MMEGSDTEAPSSIETQAANCKFYHFLGGPIWPFFSSLPTTRLSWVPVAFEDPLDDCRFMALMRLYILLCMGLCNIIVLHPR